MWLRTAVLAALVTCACAILPLDGSGGAAAGVGEACKGGKGTCKDLDVSSCTGDTPTGLCPGPTNVKCCMPKATAAGVGEACNGGKGTCKDLDVSSCAGDTPTGLCPGPTNVKCCMPKAPAAGALTRTNHQGWAHAWPCTSSHTARHAAMRCQARPLIFCCPHCLCLLCPGHS
jgi:hypothetical protein